jgi:hypothetical protein
MAATLKLTDIAHSSGAGTITVDSLATLSVSTGKLLVGGSAIEAGSSNILRKTTDYTILEADVSGKSELVIAANAASSNRTITLPAVATTGLANCIVTIICDTDATSTYELKIQDIGTTEVWTGFQKGDFVRLIVSNSAWLVVDHKETMFSSRYLTANQSIAAGATAKLTGFTNIVDIGKVWDDTNNKLVSPFAGIWDINHKASGINGGEGTCPAIYVGGSNKYVTASGTATDGYYKGQGCTAAFHFEVAASVDIELYSKNVYSSGAYPCFGGDIAGTGFACIFTRTY